MQEKKQTKTKNKNKKQNKTTTTKQKQANKQDTHFCMPGLNVGTRHVRSLYFHQGIHILVLHFLI